MVKPPEIVGDPSSGYYRDPRARGLKSGRISPRVPIRLPARDRIDLARGLVDVGDVYVRQGMLFHPDEIQETPISEIAMREGVPTLRPSSMPGFLSGLTGSEGGRTTPTEQKINALTKYKEALAIPDKTIAGAVAHAQSYMTGVAPAAGESWYADKAADAIPAAARRAGEQASEGGIPAHISGSQMRGAVAQFSAQKPWDQGNAQEGTYRITNVDNPVGLPAHMARGLSPRTYRVGAVSEGFPVAGETVMPQTGDVMEKAGAILSGDVHPGTPHTSQYDKIATFDSALHFGLTQSRPLKRHLSNAMVVDTHQARVGGLPNYDVVSNIKGGYDVAAMVSRRAGLRAGIQALNAGLTPSLPIENQETSWSNIRGGSPLGQMSLFDEKGGSLVPKNWDKQDKWIERTNRQMVEGRPPAKSSPKKAAPKKAKKSK